MKDDVKVFLEGWTSDKKKSRSRKGTRKARVRQLSGIPIEDLMFRTSTMMSMLAKKPHETPESKISTTETLLSHEVSANWKDHARACASKLSRHANSDDEEEMIVVDCDKQFFKN